MPKSPKPTATPSLDNALGNPRPGQARPAIDQTTGNGGETHQNIAEQGDHRAVDVRNELSENFVDA